MINISSIEYAHADYFGTFKNIKNIVDQINNQNLIYSTNFIIDPSTIYSNILGDKTEFITWNLLYKGTLDASIESGNITIVVGRENKPSLYNNASLDNIGLVLDTSYNGNNVLLLFNNTSKDSSLLIESTITKIKKS